MARARNIKPGFFKNEDLAECSPWARLCFAGLWTLADRDGRLEDRPKRIKGELFAYDSVEVDPLLCELVKYGFIVRYQVDGGSFIQILKFGEHQTPHYSEKKSVIKPPPLQGFDIDDDDETPRVLQDDSKKEVSLRGGRNPLNPESLFTDSLNPDSSEAKASDVKPSAKPPVDKSKTELWKSAVSLLGGQGMPEPQARSLIGKLSKDYKSQGEDIVFRAVQGAVSEQPADARAYLKATCQRLAGERKRDGSHDWTAEAI